MTCFSRSSTPLLAATENLACHLQRSPIICFRAFKYCCSGVSVSSEGGVGVFVVRSDVLDPPEKTDLVVVGLIQESAVVQ